jgi:hypothetical protein
MGVALIFVDRVRNVIDDFVTMRTRKKAPVSLAVVCVCE